MAAEKQTAYVLPEGWSSSDEPQQFPGFPGLWSEGEPLTAAQVGLDDEQMQARILELGLPLEETEVDPVKVDTVRTGGILSGATLRSEPQVIHTEPGSSVPGLSQEDLEARIEEEADFGSFSPVIEAAMDAQGVVPEVKRAWPAKHEGLEQFAAAQDPPFVFTDEQKTIDQRVAALEAAGFAPPVVSVTGVEG